MKSERRRSDRLTASEKDILVYTRDFKPFAKVKDISTGGLRVVISEPLADGPRNRLLHIFADDFQGFVVPSVSCSVIYDILQLSEGTTYSGEVNRIVGFEFEHLSASQRNRLEALLQSLPINE